MTRPHFKMISTHFRPYFIITQGRIQRCESVCVCVCVCVCVGGGGQVRGGGGGGGAGVFSQNFKNLLTQNHNSWK